MKAQIRRGSISATGSDQHARRAAGRPGKGTVAIAFGLIIALVLGACSGGDGYGRPSTGTTKPTEGTTALASAAASGCGTKGQPQGSQWNEVLAKAKQEEPVKLYVGLQPSDFEALKAAFEKAHPGIKVTGERLTTPSLIQRVGAEVAGRTTTADVVITLDNGWLKSRPSTEVQTLVGPDVTSSANTNLLGPTGTYALALVNVVAWGYNTNIIKNQDVKFTDLVNGSFNGQIGLTDYAASPLSMAYFVLWEEKYGAEFMNKLAGTKPKFYANATIMAGASASGEIGVATVVTPSAFPPGAPVKIMYEDRPPGSGWYIQARCDGKSPNGAQVFANWMLTKDAQTTFGKSGGSASVVDGATTQFKLGDVSVIDNTIYTQARLDDLLKKYNTLFGR
jgi:iron(III) transport system substrate-binding protein